jgi:hypothetical protein
MGKMGKMGKKCQRLIEIVPNFPKELVIAFRDTGVSYLIGTVKSQFCSEFQNRPGVYVANRRIPRIPFRRKREAIINWLLECELPASAVGSRNDVSGKVIPTEGNPRAVLPLLGKRRVNVISRVIGSLPNRKEQVIPNKKGPA